MKTKSYKIKEKISDALELPKDITLDIPKVTILGKDSITVENHKGIISYNDNQIRINTTCGILTILGEGLTIKSIIQEEIIIIGKISNIGY
ncbi:sporulation protein YqfC [Lutispora thermophila]|uniref:Sporulation protein YqfC n=1 Tax=Lutispora thermophila DSM 19022 TaxID=1122184 RepID=A0A1M6ESN3_9FIRM|nr:sporulation protein YqfC [Lutispora thermophila]SHI88413.1 sporulation protein YqfC [Lutispora thermophila DSM 19022]